MKAALTVQIKKKRTHHERLGETPHWHILCRNVAGVGVKCLSAQVLVCQAEQKQVKKHRGSVAEVCVCGGVGRFGGAAAQNIEQAKHTKMIPS